MKKLSVFISVLVFVVPISIASGLVIIQNRAVRGGAAGCPSGTIGTSAVNTADSHINNKFVYSELPASNYTPGQVSSCWCHFNNISGGQGITLGIYDSSGNILAYRNQNSASSTEAWQGGALNTSVCLVAGQTYYAGIVTQDTAWNQYRQTSTTGSNIKEITMTYATILANASFASATLDISGAAADFQCNDTGISP